MRSTYNRIFVPEVLVKSPLPSSVHRKCDPGDELTLFWQSPVLCGLRTNPTNILHRVQDPRVEISPERCLTLFWHAVLPTSPQLSATTALRSLRQSYDSFLTSFGSNGSLLQRQS